MYAGWNSALSPEKQTQSTRLALLLETMQAAPATANASVNDFNASGHASWASPASRILGTTREISGGIESPMQCGAPSPAAAGPLLQIPASKFQFRFPLIARP